MTSASSTILAISLKVWITTAAACAILPILQATPQLRAVGSIAPALVAVAIGVIFALTLGILLRQVFGLGASRDQASVWRGLDLRDAALLGVICWGLPVGLIFAQNGFLKSSDVMTAGLSLLLFVVGGGAFGLALRRFA